MSPQTTIAPGLPPALTNEELLERHYVTRESAAFCRQQLRTYLDGLAPLFRPRRIMGELVEGAGRESVADSQQNFAALKESFFRVCGRPFDLRRDIAPPIESPPTQMQISEWEYVHNAGTGRERKPIMVTAPLTWVLTYPSVYSLPSMRQVMAGKQERDSEAVRSFVLRACILNLMFERLPQLKALLEGLRFNVEFRKLPDLGELPLVTISSPISTFRPCDDMLLVATGLSGRAGFQEVLDTKSAASLPDPLRERIAEILHGHPGIDFE